MEAPQLQHIYIISHRYTPPSIKGLSYKAARIYTRHISRSLPKAKENPEQHRHPNNARHQQCLTKQAFSSSQAQYRAKAFQQQSVHRGVTIDWSRTKGSNPLACSSSLTSFYTESTICPAFYLSSLQPSNTVSVQEL
jgi:hypothetical protein